MFTREISGLTAELSGNGNSAFALHEANHFRDFILWWYLHEHVNMIGHEMAFQNLAFFLVSQLVKYSTQPWAYLAVESFPSPFRDEDNMVLQIPF